MSKQTREAWLNDLVEGLKPKFEDAGAEIPQNLRVSCGWPSSRALSKNRRRIGECWSPKGSKDGVSEIFISPFLDNKVEVAATLVHELCHAVVGTEAKHGKVFGKLARKVGLEGKMTATTAGEELTGELVALLERMKEYPHAGLSQLVSTVKKQGTRMVKMECSGCGYIARTTRKWLDVGVLTCVCGVKMSAKGGEEEEGGGE